MLRRDVIMYHYQPHVLRVCKFKYFDEEDGDYF